jgi:YesN/AraC family two-component response regulator
MYKMVIADDEALVCKYLRYVVKEKHLPFDICGEAKNGNDALQLVEKYTPTFVILDINMPILNGLETAKIIRKNYPDTIIYILTAYRQFDYVHDAMHANVFDYLVKPIKPDDLVEILKKGIEKALKQRISARRDQRITQQLTKDYPLILCQQLRELFEKSNEEYTVLKTLRRISHRQTFYPTAIISIAYEKKGTLTKSKSEKQLIGKQLHLFDKHAITISMGNEIIMIFDCWNTELHKELQIQLKMCEKTSFLIMYAGMDIVKTPVQINEAYDNAKKNRKMGSFWHEHGLWEVNIRQNMDTVNYTVIYKEIENNLLEHNTDKAILTVHELLDTMHRNFLRPEFVHTTCIRIACTLIDKLGEYILSAADVSLLQKEYISKINNAQTVTTLEQVMNTLIDTLIKHTSVKNQNNAEQTVQWAVTYINNNYDKEVTLEQIANELFVSPGYLCRIFKKHVGKRYASYVTDIRMKKAKELLCSGKFTVTEVAYKVGFNDASYFSSVFKKYYAQPPCKFLIPEKG